MASIKPCCVDDCDEHTIAELLRQNNLLLSEIRSLLAGDEQPTERCPHCGNTDPDKILNTAAMGDSGRKSCAAPGCGKSWREEARG